MRFRSSLALPNVGTGRSATSWPVSTATTPGDCSASVVSTEVIRAWANGLRTNTAWVVPSGRRLSTNVPWPDQELGVLHPPNGAAQDRSSHAGTLGGAGRCRRGGRLGHPYLKCVLAITSHCCCGNWRQGVREVSPATHDQPTRERVVRSILVNGASTAAALAERLDLTPAAVRRHLDALLEEGMIAAREPRSQADARPRPTGQGLRAHRGRTRPLRPAVRRPRGPGAPVPGRDRRRATPSASSPTAGSSSSRSGSTPPWPTTRT